MSEHEHHQGRASDDPPHPHNAPLLDVQLRVRALESLPDLNPIEQVWGNVKSQELANLCADSIGDLSDASEDGLDRISSDAPLCFAFLRHTGL
jgi:hypothetical protein